MPRSTRTSRNSSKAATTGQDRPEPSPTTAHTTPAEHVVPSRRSSRKRAGTTQGSNSPTKRSRQVSPAPISVVEKAVDVLAPFRNSDIDRLIGLLGPKAAWIPMTKGDILGTISRCQQHFVSYFSSVFCSFSLVTGTLLRTSGAPRASRIWWSTYRFYPLPSQ